jgi:Protein of unknown function (DUF3225)
MTVHTPAAAVLDQPGVVTGVRAAFDRYERALADGDVAVLTELFWDDERCVRFGVADRQQGAAEIAAWRAAHRRCRPAGGSPRPGCWPSTTGRRW